MTGRFLAVLFFLSVLLASSQQDSIKSTIKITLPNSTAYKINTSTNIFIPVEKNTKTTKVLTKPDITSTFWDTTNYNPYKNEIVKYPFQITFTDSVFASPVKHKKVVTSHYGWRRGRPHRGIDIDLVTGDSVFSLLDGVVRLARHSRTFGRMVVIRHYNGLETTYAHLSKIDVKPNDVILKGQYIGKGGNTGRSAGSHLHIVTSYKGQYIHPEYLFDFSAENKIRSKELWVTKDWTRASFYSAQRKPKLDLLTTKEQALAKTVKTRKVYVVKSGDTLSRISKQNHVSISKICKTNRIRKTSTLRIGQKLILEM